MEVPAAALRRGSSTAARSEEDQFYEDMEAPKFVDFTVPDHSRPDDRSWFCARIGCDQNHEEVDPDALYKSFLLRVMAARSPNVRLQKALSRQQAPGAMTKCPRSAPPKTAKASAKLGVLGSISGKIGVSSKLKVHPIASLRSTPNPSRSAKRPPTAEKAMTTPRNRMHPPNEEQFWSAKNSKVRAPAPTNKTVVKALIFQTPKRAEDGAASAHRTRITELRAGMKKIKVGGNRGAASVVSVSGSNAQAHKCLSKVREDPMDQDASRLQPRSGSEACSVEVNRKAMESSSVCEGGKEGEERAPPSSIKSGDQTGLDSLFKPEGEEPKEKPVDSGACNGLGDEKGEKEMENFSSDFDENKENALEDTYDTNRDINLNTIKNETENCQNKNCNLPRKAIVIANKTPQESSVQGAKYKALKPTNPKPFRLRTDERGILREANLERGNPQKETPVMKTQARTKQVSIKSRKADEPESVLRTQRTKARTKQVSIKSRKADEPESVLSTQRTKPLQDCEEKSTQNTRKKTRSRTPRQLPESQSVTASENAPTSLLGVKKETQAVILRPKERVCKAQAENSTNTTTMSPHVHKKAITVPKAPVFHKINVPKGCCTKRLEKGD